MTPAAAVAIVACGAAISAVVILIVRPLLLRHALAKPNERSSHVIPTPQGGGIGVIAGVVGAVLLAQVTNLVLLPADSGLTLVLLSAVILAILGLLDDLWSLPVLPRLAVQVAAAGLVVAALPAGFSFSGFLPEWSEKLVLLVALTGFVNAVNFMDGLDWMTVAEIVPITAALGIAGWLGGLPAPGIIIALALLGAMLGFAPFNRPVARLFLGDVGSLPIGLLVGFALILLAGSGHLAAALLLPLYYLADVALTLHHRRRRGEKLWQSHRSHYYQRATTNGLSVRGVVSRVFALNLVLGGLALATVAVNSSAFDLVALALGCASVAVVLAQFARRPRTAA